MSKREFYIGYLPKAPAGIAGFRAKFATGILAVTVLVVAIVAFAQRELPAGTFEFGVEKSFEGAIDAGFTPILHPEDGAGAVLLVGTGKFAYDPPRGESVRILGSLIETAEVRMVEVHETAPSDAPTHKTPASVSGAAVTLVGELVDTKCYLGVMRPATGKVHRACAVRCLSGGIPPGLLVRDAEGEADVYVLEGPDGGELLYDVQWAGLTIQVTGSRVTNNGVELIRVTELERVLNGE